MDHLLMDNLPRRGSAGRLLGIPKGTPYNDKIASKVFLKAVII